MERQIMADIAVGVILFIQALWDWRHKEILISVSLIGLGLGILWSVWNGSDYREVILALIPAILFFLLNIVSRGAVGMGDAIILVFLGFFYSLEEIVAMCSFAFLAASAVALYMLVVMQKKGKEEIPFIPFLWFGWLLKQMI